MENGRATDAPIHQTRMNRWPAVLMLVLKRWDPRRGLVDHDVYCNNTITVAGLLYKLKSAVAHIGHTAMSGHYVAYRAAADGVRKYDDSRIGKTTTDFVTVAPSETIYVLIYEKVTEASENLLPAGVSAVSSEKDSDDSDCVLIPASTAARGGPSNDGENGQPTLTAKEIMEALNKADRDLTPDQRHVYLLRGFGRRLPDMPSMEASAGPLAEAYDSALRVHKVRKMLQDYCTELVESGASVGTDVFIRNLQSSGVIKGGKHWEPEFSLQDVATESGIVAMTVSNPTQPILDELISAHIASGTVQEDGIESSLSIPGSRGSPRHRAGSDRQASKLPNDRHLPAAPTAGCEPFEKYTFFAQLGRDVQEIGVGYPALFLSYWVKNSL
ncbi:unnamed protein product [Symbiodinium sp. CCMP2456]|nr:unnamed protein product [Symbiodinium sp. CCMP2456]